MNLMISVRKTDNESEIMRLVCITYDTLPKTNMDTQNDGLGKVTPFKHGNCWYLC